MMYGCFLLESGAFWVKVEGAGKVSVQFGTMGFSVSVLRPLGFPMYLGFRTLGFSLLADPEPGTPWRLKALSPQTFSKDRNPVPEPEAPGPSIISPSTRKPTTPHPERGGPFKGMTAQAPDPKP